MKIFLIVGLMSMLIGCSKPDYSKPHEYLNAIGYGDGWVSTENNEIKFHLTKAQIYSELGSGKCEKYLKSIDAEKIFVEMAVTNYRIHTELESGDNIPIKYATLQCVAYHGQDQDCETKRLEVASRRDSAAFFLLTVGSCDISREIGQARTFSLDDSKSYKFIPK
ncbi:MAG: hypothetical protein Q7S69_09915 [Nitrosomonadaceae bacterium]|nr:hypothetical protein [Nitrosomonadaceae bacterium]